MLRFGLKQVGRLLLGLLGAALLAACVSAVAGTDHKSLAGRLFERLTLIASLDFGQSAVSARSAWADLAQCLPVTLELVGLGGLLGILIGAPLGFVLSERRAVGPILQFASALPVFCVALGLLWLSRRGLHWSVAAQGASLVLALRSGDLTLIVAALRAVAAPALTVGLAGAYAVQYLLRRAMAAAAHEPYRQGLRALGLGRFEIDGLYLFPQVLGSFFYNLGELVLPLVAAAAVAEWVFDWPGAA
ncbi:MAG TPA: ABC transporter permease subunit, partial [Rhizomicrobium sp.]|nr:ABC transporter permease subunit [Rhizomicrobium sp.]